MSKENCESEARKKIAASIGATPEEIYFTSGRADGHLKALKAVVKASKKARPHVIITTMEDPEVLDECSRLERKDAVVTYLDPITTGRVEVAMIENELKENTELISVTAANCQTGTSEPFTGIGTMTSEKGVIFHTDAAFAFGKMPINVERSHIDMLTADASYFGGPENAGFLYVRKSTGAGEYVSETAKTVKKGQKIQDAHEAIRPTDISRTPVQIKESLTRDQFRLYQLIWKRFAASRMAPAKYETTSVKVAGGDYTFTVSASKVAFEGFLSVYMQEEDMKKGNVLSQSLSKGMKLKLKELKPEQHFTQPPAHYTEASLVKTMEELGIGRPSTYAPTITTIISRRYVSKEQRNLYVTELGEVVNSIMKQAFPSIVDVNFTATMEGLLDCVENGTVQWKTVVRNFYPDLKHDVDAAQEELEKVDIHDEETDVICDNCGRHMVIKYGPHGRFLACPGFPECRNTKPYYEKIGVACPKCGKEVVLKKTKKGRKYYGCEDNPECDFMSWQKPSDKKCPVCGSYMVEKGNKLVCSQETCGYVEARPKDEKEN